MSPVESVYPFHVLTLDGQPHSLSMWRGRVMLIVNVASQCGFTPQYAGLEALYRKYEEQGLLVLGFPCDQFLHQEPGEAAEIGAFCTKNFGVTFPLFAKVRVNGRQADPLFKFLKRERPGLLGTRMIKWNFTKFLVDRAGHVVARFGPRTTPEEIEPEIVRLLEDSN